MESFSSWSNSKSWEQYARRTSSTRRPGGKCGDGNVGRAASQSHTHSGASLGGRERTSTQGAHCIALAHKVSVKAGLPPILGAQSCCPLPLTEHAVAPHELGHPGIPVLERLRSQEVGELHVRLTVVRAEGAAAAALKLGQDDSVGRQAGLQERDTSETACDAYHRHSCGTWLRQRCALPVCSTGTPKAARVHAATHGLPCVHVAPLLCTAPHGHKREQCT